MDIKNILENNYSIGDIEEVIRLKSGVSNENYKVVTSAGNFIARICHFEPLNQINVMITFLEYAASISYDAPHLVKTKASRGYFGAESEPVIVMTLVNGTTGIYDAINNEQLRSLGSALAQLHQLPWSPKQVSKTNTTTYILDVYRQFSRVRIERNEKNDRFLNILEQDYDYFASDAVQHQLRNLPTGLIHNDVIPENVLFDGNKVLSFVDLEEIGQGIMLFDIARVLNNWCLVDNQPRPDRMAAFLKSYNSSRHFSSNELKALPTAMHFISFRNSVFGLKMLAQKRIVSVSESKDYAQLTYVRQNQLNLADIIGTTL